MPSSGPEPTGSTPGKPYALVVLLQLHWFIRLRWLFAAAALATLALERVLSPAGRRPLSLLWAVLGVAGINVVWTGVSHLLRQQLKDPEANQRTAIRSGQLFAGAQIAVDLLLLTWILGLTGGVENPMSVFYLFHIAISGLLLRTWQAAVEACWASALFAGLCIGQARGWLPYYPLLPHLGAAGLHNVVPHVTLVIAVITLAIFGTLYFTDRIGKVMDRREMLLIEANAALKKSQQAIQDLQRRRSRFMQTAAHQLKSPLAMVQTMANLVLDDIVTKPQDVKATCEKIVRRARDGMAQVTELLALARVQEADPYRSRDARSHIGKVVTDVCQRYLPVARDRKVELGWDIPDCPDLQAFVDAQDLRDCVGNLIDNAIKYTPAGGHVEVKVFCGKHRPEPAASAPAPRARIKQRIDEYVYVIVKDTGMGISELTQRDPVRAADSLFDAFRRGQKALEAGIPGTGLGLSIVREVVEQAGGHIHVFSRPNEGSTFTVCFPTQRGEPDHIVRDTRSSEIVVERGTRTDGRPHDNSPPGNGGGASG